jgi:ATP adenylyltransferase
MVVFVFAAIFSIIFAEQNNNQQNSKDIARVRGAQDAQACATAELIKEQCGRSFLYAPWRDVYKPAYQIDPNQKKDACAFCGQLALDTRYEREFLILARTQHFAIFMNAYPYGKGHLLIMPNKHVATIGDLSAQERAEFMELTALALEVLQEVLSPDGINVGINQGKAAGASIPGHLHMHVLPRWQIFESSIPVFSDVRVIDCDMPALYEQLRVSFSAKLPESKN